MFHLTKWYLDLVTEDGTTFIGYVGRVYWHGLRASFAATLITTPNGQVRERATIRGVRLPARHGDTLCWENEALGVDGRWASRSPSIRRALFRSDLGSIGWSCVMPAADACVRCDGIDVRGIGYAERLRLTLPPWQLPFHTLRWGRFLSPNHALVWIDWTGGVTKRWVWLDGAPQPCARVHTYDVTSLDEDRMLTIQPGTVLRRRHLLSTVGDLLPSVARRLPPTLSGVHEHKSLGRGVLRDPSGGDEQGWAIHEIVTWSRESKPS